jgi:hypothetical protein
MAKYRIHEQYAIDYETSKDEVIYHLAWMLAKHGVAVRVVYPDGTVWADFHGADGDVVKELGE